MTITVKLYLSEILYDVQNKTYLTGRSQQGAAGAAQVANMQADDEEENKNQLLRSMGNALAVLKGELNEYLRDTSRTTNNVLMSGTGSVILTFYVPSNFSFAARVPLCNAIHGYMVSRTIAEWFVITNKADAESYIAQSAEHLGYAKLALGKRVRPARPTSSGETIATGYWGTGAVPPETSEAAMEGNTIELRGNSSSLTIETSSSDKAKCHWVVLPTEWAVAKVVEEHGFDFTDMLRYEELDGMLLYYYTSRIYIDNKSIFTLVKE